MAFGGDTVNSAELELLKSERQKKQNELTKAENSLRDEENTYNSMYEFSGVAKTTCNNFSSMNSGSAGALADAKSVQKNCRTAKEYCNGMEHIFSKIGGKIVGGLLSDLSSFTSKRLKDHSDNVNGLEKKINLIKKEIEELDRRIAQLEEPQMGGR